MACPDIKARKSDSTAYIFKHSSPCLLTAKNGQRAVPPRSLFKEGFAAQLWMYGQLVTSYLLLRVCTHRKLSQGQALHWRACKSNQAKRGYKAPPLRPSTGHSGFPGGPVVQNSPVNAPGFDGRSRKITRAAGQLSPCASTAEPACSSP